MDLGGTKIQTVVLRARKVVGQSRVPTPQTGAADVVNAIAGTVTAALKEAGSEVTELKAIGIGTPGVSSLNFGGTQYAFSNAITVGFGTGVNAGKIAVYISNNVPTHIVVDVFAYIH